MSAGWERVWLAPHVLRDVTDVDLRADLLGTADVPLVVSSNTGTPFEEIGATGVGW